MEHCTSQSDVKERPRLQNQPSVVTPSTHRQVLLRSFWFGDLDSLSLEYISTIIRTQSSNQKHVASYSAA